MLIFGNDRFDFRKFPNLMTNRFRIGAGEAFAAASTLGRNTRHDFLAFLDGNQGAFVFFVTGLAAAFAF